MNNKLKPRKTKKPEREYTRSDTRDYWYGKDVRGNDTFASDRPFPTGRGDFSSSYSNRNAEGESKYGHTRGKTSGIREPKGIQEYETSKDRSRSGRVQPNGRSVSENVGNSQSRTHRSSNSLVSNSSEHRKIKFDSKLFDKNAQLCSLISSVYVSEDHEERIKCGKDLLDYICNPENVKSVSDYADPLLESLYGILGERAPRELKANVVQCLASVGYIVVMESPTRYMLWIFQKLADTSTEIKIFLFQSLLQMLKKDEPNQSLEDIIQMLLSNCQTVLENAEQSDLLTAVVDIMAYTSRIYVNAFSSHFVDTVDILVGWYIDPNQSETILNYTCDTLVSFHEYWLNDLSFSTTLLGQFLEDMEAYAEDFVLGTSKGKIVDDDLPLPEDCVIKIISLFRVYTTVLRSLGEDFGQRRLINTFTQEYILENLKRMVKSMEAVDAELRREVLLTTANDCFGTLIEGLAAPVSRDLECLIALVVRQLSAPTIPSAQRARSLLTLTRKLLEVLSTQVPLELISQLLSRSSLLMKLRFVHDKQILTYLMNVMEVLMSMKTVPLMEEAYRHILADLELSLNSLLKSCSISDASVSLVSSNPHTDSQYSAHDAVVTAVFCLTVVAELGNNKSNLIAMWALTPSVFSLITHHLLPVCKLLSEQYPVICFTALQTLHSHCNKHTQFTASSSLSNHVPTIVDTGLGAPTKNHFASIVGLLSEMINFKTLPYDSKCLILCWANDVVESLTNVQQLFGCQPVSHLLTELVSLGESSRESEFVVMIINIMKTYVMVCKLPEQSLLIRCINLSMIKLADTSTSVRLACCDLLVRLPLDLLIKRTSNIYNSQSFENSGVESLRKFERSMQSKLCSGTFANSSFKHLMTYILNGPGSSSSGSMKDWLQRVYHNSQRLDSKADGSGERDDAAHSSLMDSSYTLLWFWVTLEAAQLCVTSKLRTPLGKPQETFTSIEAAIRKFAAIARESEEVNNNKTVIKTDAKDSLAVKSPISENFDGMLPVNGLLMFMEHLEKALYNACEGTAVAMATYTPPVRLFFRTNHKTCQEWFHRIRSPLITVARHAGHPAIVLRQVSELLTSLRHDPVLLTGDIESAVKCAVEALVQLRCPEAIMGFYVWYKEISGKKQPWIKAMAEMAAGRYESSIDDMQLSVKSLLSGESGLDDASRDKVSVTPGPMSAPGSVKLMSRQSGANLASVNKHSQDAATLHMVINQVANAYSKLRSWQDIIEWESNIQLQKAECSDSALQKALYLDIDTTRIRTLIDFEAGNISDNVNGLKYDSAQTWGWKALIDQGDWEVMKAITLKSVNSEHSKDRFQQCVNESSTIAQTLLTMNAIGLIDRQSEEILLQHFSAFSLQESAHQRNLMIKTTSSLNQFENSWLDSSENVSVLLRALNTIKMCQKLPEIDTITEFNNILSHLRIATAKVARKSQNLRLAGKLLREEAESLLPPSVDSTLSLTNLLTLVKSRPILNMCQVANLERETAKLAHCRGENNPESCLPVLLNHCLHTQNFISEMSSQAVSPRIKIMQDALGDLRGKSLITLVKWLQLDVKTFSSLISEMQAARSDVKETESWKRNVAVGLNLLMTEEENKSRDNWEFHLPADDLLTDLDLVAGRLLRLATTNAPLLPKGWFSFAGWCYKWGRKAVEVAIQKGMDLNDDEKSKVLSILSQECSNSDMEAVIQALSHLHSGIGLLDDDVTDQEQSCYDDGSDACRKQLLTCLPQLAASGDTRLDDLINVWHSAVKRVYHYYDMSAHGYFTYLKITGESSEGISHMDGNVNATLRLLRLMVKHAWELRQVLEEGLANTPTLPWKGIIPQLFSRLNHPEAYVRRSISDLLCRVAHDSPHLIVYPAVVGSSSASDVSADSTQDGLLNECLSQKDSTEDVETSPVGCDNSQQDDSDSTTGDESNATMLQNCFMSIVDTLAKSNMRMITEVQLLVSELQRVTLLWDELWLGVLSQISPDVGRRLTQLDNEIRKVKANTSLAREEKTLIIEEKMRIILKPTLHALEHIADITRQPAETAHEQWFQHNYGHLIDEALAKLRKPVGTNTPQSIWHPFKQLQQSLQQRALKRQSLILSLPEISRKLAAFKGTTIAMPGVSVSAEAVTIESIANIVQILPTKTKPKKLIFIGSDGKKYPYLFKGLEDLHLDERIMQFLSIVNNMFVKANRENGHLYHARHYSVTPLGARSGLIQWVDGATAIFSLYKRWQQREAAAQLLKQGSASNVAITQPVNVPRPSEVFFGKLQPLLKEKGITNLDKRSEWPVSVQCRVLEDLVRETPGDLLARELWCSSTSADSWWSITKTYACSTAVMSMIGYIIGLGDRHLDNILVDLTKGEVIHIDYNVCFDKGRSLRVPEKVPFRMTQNIENALGVTGVEGIFRHTCELVLKVMRKGRETLLTLLEAFVYDPLVDWTITNESGYTGSFNRDTLTRSQKAQRKRRLELEITLGMFAIRVAEIKTDWLNNRDEMVALLNKMKEQLISRLATVDELKAKETMIEQLQEIITYLEEAAQHPQHPAHTLAVRFGEYSVFKSRRLEILNLLQEKIRDCHIWQKAHEYAFSSLQQQKLQPACAEVAQSIYTNLNVPVSLALAEFLQGAGQQQLLTQFQASSDELANYLHQQCALINVCLSTLTSYSTVVGHFPSSYLASNRSAQWYMRLNYLTENLSSSRCVEVKEQYEVWTESLQSNRHSILLTETKLQEILSTDSNRLVHLLNRRNLETLDMATLSAVLDDTLNTLTVALTESSESMTRSIFSVLMSTLTTLTYRYEMMESSAIEAGDQLSELTSRDGDWFLDELMSLSTNVNHLLKILAVKTLAGVDENLLGCVIKVLQATFNVLRALQDLKANFQTIILPEAFKIIQSEDPSLLQVISDIDIITSYQFSIEDLLVTLNSLTTGDADPSSAVSEMRKQFDKMVGDSPSIELTAGKMLLMAFNGLFVQVDSDFSAMTAALSELSQFSNEAETYLAEFCAGRLDDIFFVMRLRTIQGFFNLLRQSAAYLEGPTDLLPMDDDQLARPVRAFIGSYILKHLSGLPTMALKTLVSHWTFALGGVMGAEIRLDEQCRNVVENELKAGVYNVAELTQAGTLVTNVETAYQRADIVRRLDSNIALAKASHHRAQLQLVRYQWLHEVALIFAGFSPAQFAQPARASVMVEIRKALQAMLAHESLISDVHEKCCQLQLSIAQRLKWAAGANPQIAALLQQFDDSAVGRTATVQAESALVQELVTLANTIIHFEAARTQTTESHNIDTAMLSVLDRCLEGCLQWEEYGGGGGGGLSELEELLTTTCLLSPDQMTDHQWIESSQTKVLSVLNDTRATTNNLINSLGTTKETVKGHVSAVRSLITHHQQLMTDVKTVLKTLIKQEEHNQSIVCGGFKSYVDEYKIGLESLTTLLRRLVNEERYEREVINEFDSVIASIYSIYDGLIAKAPELGSAVNDNESKDTKISVADDSTSKPMTKANVNSSASASHKQDKVVARDPKTGKVIQERNSYAVGVWRQVKAKLDGRDPDVSRRQTISEQVDYVIKESKSLENLAVLYEGWTSWV